MISLEIKLHTVPHLKALPRSIERRGGHGQASIFRGQKLSLKSTVLLHKWPKRRFNVTVAVLVLPKRLYLVIGQYSSFEMIFG